MQTTSFENHTPVMSMQLKTENQYLPRRRDGKKCRAILAAVQEWESSLRACARPRRAAGGRTVGETKRARYQRQ